MCWAPATYQAQRLPRGRRKARSPPSRDFQSGTPRRPHSRFPPTWTLPCATGRPGSALGGTPPTERPARTSRPPLPAGPADAAAARPRRPRRRRRPAPPSTAPRPACPPPASGGSAAGAVSPPRPRLRRPPRAAGPAISAEMKEQPFGAARPAPRLYRPASFGSSGLVSLRLSGPVSFGSSVPAAWFGLRRNAGAHVDPHCACAEALAFRSGWGHRGPERGCTALWARDQHCPPCVTPIPSRAPPRVGVPPREPIFRVEGEAAWLERKFFSNTTSQLQLIERSARKPGYKLRWQAKTATLLPNFLTTRLTRAQSPFPPLRLGTALGVRSLQRVPRWKTDGGYVGKWANRGAGHGAGALGREGYANVVDILGPPELKGGNPGAAAAATGLGPVGAPL